MAPKPDIVLLRGERTVSLECGCRVEMLMFGDEVKVFFCDAHRRVKVVKRDPKWPALARAAVASVARRLERFTTDDVWEELANDGAEGGDPRAMGPIMNAATTDGLVEPTDDTTPSKRRECHGRPVRVWRSLVKRRK